MAGDDFERAEVDRLVQELASRRVAAKRPVVSPAAAGKPPAAPAAQPAAPAAEPRRPASPSRWTTARLLMPAMRTEPRRPFALVSGMQFPALPRLTLPELTESQLSVLTARMFVGLGLALGAAMPYWPYSNTCSWGLMLYLSAVLLVVVTGVWGAKLTWDARLGAAHTLALCAVFWGLTLVTAQVLPRVGYAQYQEPWFCPW